MVPLRVLENAPARMPLRLRLLSPCDVLVIDRPLIHAIDVYIYRALQGAGAGGTWSCAGGGSEDLRGRAEWLGWIAAGWNFWQGFEKSTTIIPL